MANQLQEGKSVIDLPLGEASRGKRPWGETRDYGASCAASSFALAQRWMADCLRRELGAEDVSTTITTKKRGALSQPPSQQTRQPSMRSPRATGRRRRRNLVWINMVCAPHIHASAGRAQSTAIRVRVAVVCSFFGGER